MRFFEMTSQVPDLNRRRTALQAVAWPLRQPGTVLNSQCDVHSVNITCEVFVFKSFEDLPGRGELFGGSQPIFEPHAERGRIFLKNTETQKKETTHRSGFEPES